MSPPPDTSSILVVDDDENMRAMLVFSLERDGHRVDLAQDGVAGLAMLRTHHYDLLITDNQMPGLTGIEMIQQLRSERITLPIIMATGTLQREDLVKLDIPLVRLLLKPFSLVDLLALVEVMLTAKGAGLGVVSG